MSESDTYKVVVENLKVVGTRIAQLCSKNVKQTRLVAVSKTKPASLVKLCYDAGHRHFGENYVQELVEKAKQLPNDIRWHFIGHLQSNKCKQLLEVPSLWIVETVDSYKLAQVLDKTCTNAGRKDPLNIFVQVKTSPEATKSGIEPVDVPELVAKIIKECKNLKFCGLMTIGQLEGDAQQDFKKLAYCKNDIVEKLKLSVDEVELSMGMSSDYETGIAMGSTNVRVGSIIFGTRYYVNK